MKCIRIWMVLCICLWGLAAPADAQKGTQNALLGRIMEQLNEEYQLPEDFTGEKYLTSLIGSSKPLFVHCNAQQVIDHVGVKLFDRTLMEKYPSPLYEFIERYFLELLLEKDDTAISDRLRLERVKLSSDVPAAGNYKKWLRAIIAQCSAEHSIRITCNNNRYHVSEDINKSTIFSMYLPVRYELITGFTKVEAERAVYDSLLHHHYTEVRQPSVSDYYATSGNLFCLNEEYYGTEDIISTSYYKKQGDEFVPVFGKDDKVKSVYNLFNVPWESKQPVEVTQKLYGNKTLSYEITLGRLTNYLRKSGCSLYTGIQRMEGDTVKGVIMAVNAELGYQHFLSFKIEGPVWEGDDKGTLKIDMYSYIPRHNVSVLIEGNK